MKRFFRTPSIVMAEILIFAAMMAVIWLDEFMDIPYRLFGAPPTPYRLAEYIIETASCAVVGVVIIIGTVMILRRIDRLEKYLRVCAWCRKVWVGDRWVPFEEYLLQEHMLKASHAMCPECFHKIEANSPDEKSAQKAAY